MPYFQVTCIQVEYCRSEHFIKARRVNAKNIFTELKRRNVYRAAVAYGVVAWFLTQLTTQVFPFFEVPSYAVRFVVIALAIGFPIAMLLSWVCEFTPEGIVRTEDLQPGNSAVPVRMIFVLWPIPGRGSEHQPVRSTVKSR